MLAVVLVLSGAACGEPSDDGADGGDDSRSCITAPCPTLETDGTPRATPTAHTPSPTSTPESEPSSVSEATPGPSATDTPRAANATGTLEGYVHIGPTCPVVREGEDCDDRPHEAEMDIVDASGDVVATVQSDTAGRFAATLAPGAYRLVPHTDGRLPYASEQEFVIEAGRVTEIDVAYDSGIR